MYSPDVLLSPLMDASVVPSSSTVNLECKAVRRVENFAGVQYRHTTNFLEIFCMMQFDRRNAGSLDLLVWIASSGDAGCRVRLWRIEAANLT